MLWLGATVFLMLLALVYDRGHTSGYRDGQIDALTGQITYEKVTHKNQTTTWEKKNEVTKPTKPT